MNNPKVSIIMATYNRANFIVETLLSIQNQTYKNWECLIIDDGGTDNTQKVINDILEKDNRFKFYKRIETYKKGLPGSRNFGLDIAKGDFVIFFDDDDIVHPQNLEICVTELENNDVEFCRYIRQVFTNQFSYQFDFSKKYNSFYITIESLEKVLKNELPFNSCAVMWKSSCFHKKRFQETLMYAEEWELYSRILSTGIRGISIEKCLFYGRKHANSNTGEFYSNNPIRRESFSNAIIFVVKNLKEKDLLTNSLKIYFIKLSYNFKEFNLFKNILYNFNPSKTESFKWKLYYFFFPVQIFLYRIKKSIFNS